MIAHANLKRKSACADFVARNFIIKNVKKNFTEEQENHCAKAQGILKM